MCNDVCSLFVQRFNVESVIVNITSMLDIALDFQVYYFFLYCSLNLSYFFNCFVFNSLKIIINLIKFQILCNLTEFNEIY